MSYNRLSYDNCSYNQSLLESEGPGAYRLLTPNNVDKICLSNDPYIRAQYMGSKHIPGTSLIDVDSELMNITRPASLCPSQKYLPYPNSSSFCSAPNTHNMTPTDTVKRNNELNNQEAFNNGEGSYKMNECFNTMTEHTLLSNPPCTLRGTGWNRWEWLCKNPQDKVEVPFDHMIDSVLMAKDNHRPLLPKPMDQNLALPKPNNDPVNCDMLSSAPAVPTGPPSINWKRYQDFGY